MRPIPRRSGSPDVWACRTPGSETTGQQRGETVPAHLRTLTATDQNVPTQSAEPRGKRHNLPVLLAQRGRGNAPARACEATRRPHSCQDVVGVEAQS